MSAYSFPQASFDDHNTNYDSVNIPFPQQTINPQARLSPFSSPHAHSNPASPPISNTHTPASSIASLSVQFSHSELQEQLDLLGFDPFLGASFSDDTTQSPNFLQKNDLGSSFNLSSSNYPSVSSSATLPSPQETPYLGATSPPNNAKTTSYFAPQVVAPQDLVNKSNSQPPFISYNQLTPEGSGSSGHSSEDEMAPGGSSTLPRSPGITVSDWSGNPIPRPVEHQDDTPVSPKNPVHNEVGFTPIKPEDSPVPSASPPRWRRGLDPESRPTDEVPSLNDMTASRVVEERNSEVREWINRIPQESTMENPIQPHRFPVRVETEPDGISTMEIPTGHATENQLKDGMYFNEGGGELTKIDVELIAKNRNWGDAPALPKITKADTGRYQPETSQKAIEKYQQMTDDVGSTISRVATWGTRPRSIAGMSQKEREVMEVTSGGILKKLSISRDPSQFLKNIRRPSVSNILKRSKTDESETSTLAPPPRSTSWKRGTSVPGINTAILAMSQGAASIGAGGHARSGSVSAAPSAPSPKSPLGLGVFRRSRSKSDIARPSAGAGDHPHLVQMWRQQGGPPIGALGTNSLGDASTHDSANTSVPARQPAAGFGSDDEDEDDENFEDDMKMDQAKLLIDEIEPNMAGFQKQVLKLNPLLERENNFLVDRIAYQQVVRYKFLLNHKKKHLGYVAQKHCPSQKMCIALGGSAIVDSRNDRSIDPLSTGPHSDGDITPLEGGITQDSFPQDIPMPPTMTLPAEFECQLCYSTKSFKKPSDWTKHVHEDVQPFTCTWDRCREPKIFKRKADWVRHENEGHRHLEWWTCDVDDCHHTCYRRDNFLQHLVREHKFAEPKVKTKAAIKKMGNADPTWSRVEQCHHDTNAKPQDEPCRFCGKTFPTWKKLTVHLAKHMEHISLPILRLVAAKDLEPDTIISPVHDPPPRQFPPLVAPDGRQGDYQPLGPMGAQGQALAPGFGGFPGYSSIPPTAGYNPDFFGNSFESMNDITGMGMQQPAMAPQPQVQNYQPVQVPAPVTSTYTADSVFVASTSMEPFPPLSGPALMGTQPTMPSGLGLQPSAAGQMGYEASYVDAAGMEHFSSPHSHGSASPYGRSPHQGAGSFYQ